MSLIKMRQLDASINKKGVLMKTLVSHKNAAIRNLLLKPKQAIPPHQVPVDVFFYIIEGSGSITIGNTFYKVEEQDIVLCPPNTPMSVQASEDGLVFLNVKTPSLQSS